MKFLVWLYDYRNYCFAARNFHTNCGTVEHVNCQIQIMQLAKQFDEFLYLTYRIETYDNEIVQEGCVGRNGKPFNKELHLLEPAIETIEK